MFSGSNCRLYDKTVSDVGRAVESMTSSVSVRGRCHAHSVTQAKCDSASRDCENSSTTDTLTRCARMYISRRVLYALLAAKFSD